MYGKPPLSRFSFQTPKPPNRKKKQAELAIALSLIVIIPIHFFFFFFPIHFWTSLVEQLSVDKGLADWEKEFCPLAPFFDPC